MDTVKELLNKTEDVLQKGVDTTFISRTDNSGTLQPAQDLTPVITDVSIRSTPLVDRFLPRAKSGMGSAHSFNKRLTPTTIDPRDAIYADGALPDGISPAYSQVTVPFVAGGYSSYVTGLAQAQGRSILDLQADAVTSAMGRLKMALEWLAFYGSTSTLNTAGLPQFKGLDELITTNVVDAQGAKISGTTGKAILDEAAEKIAYQGGEANLAFTSIRTGININNTYSGNERVIVTDAGRENITWGNKIPQVTTVAGVWSFLPTYFLNPGAIFTLPDGSSSLPLGGTTSTMFIVNEQFLNFVNLLPMTLERLGKVDDKDKFFVKIYTVLELLAEEFCAKIINIDDTVA